jgi:hypothetical protein
MRERSSNRLLASPEMWGVRTSFVTDYDPALKFSGPLERRNVIRWNLVVTRAGDLWHAGAEASDQKATRLVGYCLVGYRTGWRFLYGWLWCLDLLNRDFFGCSLWGLRRHGFLHKKKGDSVLTPFMNELR